MSTRWNNIVKDYLTFSARERKGVVILLSLIAAAYLLSRFLPVKKTAPSKDAFAQELAQLKITVDSSKKTYAYHNDEDNTANYYKPKNYESSKESTGELFAFDPNTLDADGWKRLGVRDKTITTIQKFISKGFHFKQPEDIKKIYGLRHEDAERLIPFIHISPQELATATPSSTSSPANYTRLANTNAESRVVKIIDINLADTSAFISLPGIGSKLASRIIGFREKLGGFYSVNQVGETYGVPDSTFQKLKSRLQCNTPSVKKININTADINQLKAHPYIRWAIGNAIINYKTQHGNFVSLQDLRKIDIITEDVYNKMLPYLEI